MTAYSIETQDTERDETLAAADERCACAPATDIYETSEAFVLRADMPGVTDRGVEVDIERNVLTLRGVSEESAPREARRTYHERAPGAFKRVFTLGFDVESEQVEASIKNGVLEVKLPKAATARSRKIPVNAN